MRDGVLAVLDRKLRDARAAVARLERFREQYVSSPELRAVIGELVGAREEGPQVSDSTQAPTRGQLDTSGLTPAIIDIVREQPGIEAVALIDAVLSRVPTKAKKPRRSVSSTYDFLVKRGRLAKRAGRFYPVG